MEDWLSDGGFQQSADLQDGELNLTLRDGEFTAAAKSCRSTLERSVTPPLRDEQEVFEERSVTPSPTGRAGGV
ncbi:hypothetical protein F7725_017811 [Dissostichus mawsoni]|uniref:Uncharacterized protein n=1 Tax=Dissostichus mawsoni TaxID=36200 RepID=A0A7J5XPS6_DISMA|nr:hypothetical protein F7725_017811 [Dissostichus mawsoni]